MTQRPVFCASRGFTMIELLVVLAVIAVGASTVSLALRDPTATRLEREAARLVALLDAARTESRASGVPVIWVPLSKSTDAKEKVNFQFVGLPPSSGLPQHWLEPEVRAEISGADGLSLGPEPLIGAQRVTLRLEQQKLVLQTDGLAAFSVISTSTP